MVVVDGNGEEEDGDWEDVSGEEDDDEDEDEELPPVERDAIYQHGNELHLPSGAVADIVRWLDIIDKTWPQIENYLKVKVQL